MKKQVFFISILTLISAIICAKNSGDTLYFDNRVSQAMTNSQEMLVGSHQFGETFAIKMALISDIYTFTVAGDPTSPGPKTTIQKPVIYNGVKKLNTYYRQSAKKKLMDEATAKKLLNHVLDVALSVYPQPTATLESELRKHKSAEQIAEVFKRVVLR